MNRATASAAKIAPSEITMEITTADIEFMGEPVGGTILFGDANARPTLGATALASVGIERDPPHGVLDIDHNGVDESVLRELNHVLDPARHTGRPEGQVDSPKDFGSIRPASHTWRGKGLALGLDTRAGDSRLQLLCNGRAKRRGH